MQDDSVATSPYMHCTSSALVAPQLPYRVDTTLLKCHFCFKLCVYVCMCVCVWRGEVFTWLQCPWRPEEGEGFPVAGVRYDCELPHSSAGNGTCPSERAASACNH